MQKKKHCCYYKFYYLQVSKLKLTAQVKSMITDDDELGKCQWFSDLEKSGNYLMIRRYCCKLVNTVNQHKLYFYANSNILDESGVNYLKKLKLSIKNVATLLATASTSFIFNIYIHV